MAGIPPWFVDFMENEGKRQAQQETGEPKVPNRKVEFTAPWNAGAVFPESDGLVKSEAASPQPAREVIRYPFRISSGLPH